jgi:hypothetical protein
MVMPKRKRKEIIVFKDDKTFIEGPPLWMVIFMAIVYTICGVIIVWTAAHGGFRWIAGKP